MSGERKEAVRLGKLVLTLNGRRLVYAAPIRAGADPMDMTLGEWMAAPALSAAALCNDFFDRLARPLPESDDK